MGLPCQTHAMAVSDHPCRHPPATAYRTSLWPGALSDTSQICRPHLIGSHETTRPRPRHAAHDAASGTCGCQQPLCYALPSRCARVESVPARFDCIALLQCRLRARDRTRPLTTTVGQHQIVLWPICRAIGLGVLHSALVCYFL